MGGNTEHARVHEEAEREGRVGRHMGSGHKAAVVEGGPKRLLIDQVRPHAPQTFGAGRWASKRHTHSVAGAGMRSMASAGSARSRGGAQISAAGG